MNGLEKFSTIHLENCQKIVDEMAAHAATLLGCFEALRLLFPNLLATQDMIQMEQLTHQQLRINGYPLSLFLAEYSRVFQEEIEKRKA